MKNWLAPWKQGIRDIPLFVSVAALAVAFMVVPLQPARADTLTLPPMPDNLQVTDGSKVFLVGHAVGTQNYFCAPSGAGVAFKLFTPQATLFDDGGEQIITHFFSPDPSPDPAENGMIRATWQYKDTSRIWAEVKMGDASSDPKFVEKGAVAWLKLTADFTQDGPTGGDKLSTVTFVQRLSTHGGVAPSTGCATLSDLGHQAFVPYTADYFFYRK